MHTHQEFIEQRFAKSRNSQLATRNLNFAILLVFLFVSVSLAQVPENFSVTVQDSVKAVSPSIVSLQPIGTEETVGKNVLPEISTGVFISTDGYIITSSLGFTPVPSSVIVRLDSGKIYPGKVVAIDKIRKLALLKITTDSPCSVPAFAPRSEWKVGQWTIACGRVYPPDANGKSDVNVTVGILSALCRVWGRAVQTDAAVSPNNYGGPLIDIQGRVIGILVPLSPQSDEEDAGVDWYDSGIGFAVPWEDIQTVLPRLTKGENLVPGLIGFAPQVPNPSIAEPILDVVPKGSPADKAGFQKGDKILSLDGQKIETFAQFKRIMTPKTAGETVEIVCQRDVKSAFGISVPKIIKQSVTLVDHIDEPKKEDNKSVPGMVENFQKRLEKLLPKSKKEK